MTTSKDAFQFTVKEANDVLYTWNPATCRATWNGNVYGVRYAPRMVDEYLRDGTWVVKVDAENVAFPRAGVDAKLKCNSKVYIVGQSGVKDSWVVETDGTSMLRIKTAELLEVTEDDAKAYAIAKDLEISFHQAVRMVKKGYAKQ